MIVSCQAAPTKTAALAATNTTAAGREITPRGISRIAVRGFRPSYSASTRRLNPIAALRAATMATTIHPMCPHVVGCSRAANSAPVNANGSAKTE